MTRGVRSSVSVTFADDRGSVPLIGRDPLSLHAGYLLRRSHRVHNEIWSSIVPSPLTSAQFTALSVIQRHPGIDQRTLGHHMSLDRASIADIVARLVDRGEVKRERVKKDSRRNALTLSPETESSLERLRGFAASVWDEIFAPVPVRHRATFVAHLEALIDFRAEERDAGSIFRRLEQRRAATWNAVMGDEFTGGQYAVIHVVGQWPGLNQTELGGLAAVDKSTAAAIIDRLAKRGWVVREADPIDARVRRLSLTPEAAEAVTRLTPRLNEFQRRLLSPLPPEVIDRLLEHWTLVAYRGDVPLSAR